MSFENNNPEEFLNALVNYNLLAAESLEQIRREHQITGENIKAIVMKQSGITDEQILTALAYQFGYSMIDLNEVEIAPEVLPLLPAELAEKYRVIPIALDGETLQIAVDDPSNYNAMDEISMALGRPLQPLLADESVLSKRLEILYGVGAESFSGSLDDLEGGLEVLAEDADEIGDDAAGAESAPVIKFVNQILYNALKSGASDIHYECLERECKLRYRIDGVCRNILKPPKRLQGAILSRLKLMAGCDITERRIPQDGRIKMRMMGKQIDLRFSTLPTLYGESVVMRILDKSGVEMGLEQVGFLPETIEDFNKLIAKPNGIILVTGPTGSGKTSTLYAALNKLNTPDRKIITAEDPVEYQFDGINQIQIRHEIGLDFSLALRAMLRQSPNIILVGEMRDLETAEIGVRAALTGHLVFSTLHTNDAPGAFTRLIDMGVNPFLVASSIEAIMAQRLVRKICDGCKEPYEPDETSLKEMGVQDLSEVKDIVFYKGKGCEKCGQTGYKGRTAIFELLVTNEAIKDLVLGSATTTEIRKKARETGMATLREYGFLKVKLGMTTILEVQRVTPSETELYS